MLFNGQNKKIIDPRYFLREQITAPTFYLGAKQANDEGGDNAANNAVEQPAANASPAGQGFIISKGGNSNNFAIIYGGLRNPPWTTEYLSQQLKKYLVGKNVIYSNFENSIDSLRSAASQQLGVNVNITLLLGWSRGGKNILEAMVTHPYINYFLLADPSSSDKIQASQIPFEKSFMSLSTGKNGGYAKRAETQFNQLAGGQDNHILQTGNGSHWETVPKLINQHIDKFPS